MGERSGYRCAEIFLHFIPQKNFKQMKNITSILLIIGIVLLANLLSNKHFFRLDFTEDQQFTLSQATKDILKDLEEPVTISAYFSQDLPAQLAKTERDLKDMLIEYVNLSKGMVEYEFINPGESEEKETEAQQNGLRPVPISVREKDQATQRLIYLGALVQIGDRREVIPIIQPDGPVEYTLSTAIKKLAVIDKPGIGLIQGHGEVGQNELGQVVQSLGVLYNVESINLSQVDQIADRFKTVALVAPKDSFPPSDFAKLDQFLGRGGHLFLAVDAVSGDFSTAQGTAMTTGLEGWLKEKGLEIENSFVVDVNCGTVSIQQKQGFFTVNTPVKFHYLPLIGPFPEHPVTKGLEQVMLTFASPVRYVGSGNTTFTPIATTSTKAGIIQSPTFFDVANKKWNNADFPLSNIAVAGVLEGNIVGNTPSKIVLISDGEFPQTNPQGRPQSEDNIS